MIETCTIETCTIETLQHQTIEQDRPASALCIERSGRYYRAVLFVGHAWDTRPVAAY